MSTTDLKGLFYKALCSWLSGVTEREVLEVTGMESGSHISGGCETCAYTVYDVELTYRTPDDPYSWGRTYTYEGKFSDLLDQLLEQEVDGDPQVQ